MFLAGLLLSFAPAVASDYMSNSAFLYACSLALIGTVIILIAKKLIY